MANPLNLTTTGSFPRKIYDDANKIPEKAIQDAIVIQKNANINCFVDGQFRASIVNLFASQIGLEQDKIPFKINTKIDVPSTAPIFNDLETAAKLLKGLPLKAHITGPVVIAEGCEPGEQVQDLYPPNEKGFRVLALDIAAALAHEARMLGQKAEDLKLAALQIDEPTFAYGANLAVGKETLEIITAAWYETAGPERPVILHVCGDYTGIWEHLLEMPVDILNLEAAYIENLTPEQAALFKDSGKKLALGCVPVNTSDIPDKSGIVLDILFATDQLGEDCLWGITPTCGLRESEFDMLEPRLKRLYEAHQSLINLLSEEKA